jgi:hypothetical protein
MPEPLPSSSAALAEALSLSDELLRDIELSRLSLVLIALKAARLARILNDLDYQTMFGFEVSGYPLSAGRLTPESWRLTGIANRHYEEKGDDESVKEYAYCEAIEVLEQMASTNLARLGVARDPNISISSANPHQYLQPPTGNVRERWQAQIAANTATKRLAARRGFIHNYVLQTHYQLKFSGVASDVFARIREAVDGRVGSTVPSAVQKFTAVHDNLRSDNPEDWSNAVHSCRRILQDLAGTLFPATDDRLVTEGKVQRTIKLGPENYINRLVCYVEDRASSERYKQIVGSHLRFLGDRLDAVFHAAQKGSHDSVLQDEADRYVVYTYMLVGDILGLSSSGELAAKRHPK